MTKPQGRTLSPDELVPISGGRMMAYLTLAAQKAGQSSKQNMK